MMPRPSTREKDEAVEEEDWYQDTSNESDDCEPWNDKTIRGDQPPEIFKKLKFLRTNLNLSNS